MSTTLNDNPERFVEKRLRSRLVYDGNLLKVHEDVALMPDGSESKREWIRHPGACAIIPVFENGDMLLLRQYRYAPARMFWEVPAGKLDTGEHHTAAAHRELLEETGLISKQLEQIGHFYPAIGFADEIIYVYIARNLTESDSNMDDDEFVESVRLPASTVYAMLESGEIEDGKTIISLTMARGHLVEPKI
jgi:ADP-ribose pyrophosphatase